MATKTPADRAIADVEKAIKDSDKAHEKHEVLQSKADEAYATVKRSERELKWRASHPDLPEDFDLDELRRSLAEPFADDDVDPVEPDEGEVAAVAEGEADVKAGRVTVLEPDADEDAFQEAADDAKANPAEIGDADGGDDDDPWGDS